MIKDGEVNSLVEFDGKEVERVEAQDKTTNILVRANMLLDRLNLEEEYISRSDEFLEEGLAARKEAEPMTEIFAWTPRDIDEQYCKFTRQYDVLQNLIDPYRSDHRITLEHLKTVGTAYRKALGELRLAQLEIEKLRRELGKCRSDMLYVLDPRQN